jgi:hypothetical protein
MKIIILYKRIKQNYKKYQQFKNGFNKKKFIIYIVILILIINYLKDNS